VLGKPPFSLFENEFQKKPIVKGSRDYDFSRLATKDELKGEIALLRSEMGAMENRLVIKLGGLMVVLFGLAASLRHLFK
jgi:hypothetical protein